MTGAAWAGLAAILPRPGDEDGLREIPVDLIDPNPRQPRQHFDETKLAELADSIRARGVLQPIVVRPLAGGRYELVAGERRLRAARIAELELIPAMLRQADDWERLDLALAENMARAEPERGRGGARVRDARRRPRPHEGGGRPARRPQPRRDLEPDPPARPARGGARADRGRPPQRGPRPRDPALQGPRRPPPRWRARRATAPGRCARPSGARARPSTGDPQPRRAAGSSTPIWPTPSPPPRTRCRRRSAARSRPARAGEQLRGRDRVRQPAEAVELARSMLAAGVRRVAERAASRRYNRRSRGHEAGAGD